MLTNDEEAKNIELYTIMKPCNIIIATNLAGRGTDINLSEDVINNRGLHVCLTFIPRNERVEEQAFGRAGRKGEPGTYQLICNFFEEITNFTGILFTGKLPKQIQNIFLIQSDLDSELGNVLFPCFVIKEEDIDKKQNSNNNEKENIKNSILKLNGFIKKELKNLPMNYEKLIKERDLREEKELSKVNQEIDKIKLKDKLFNHYLKFIKEKKLKPNELIFQDIEEQWGLWLNKITKQEVKKDADPVNEFENWIKKYNNGLYYENYGFLCRKIQNNFIDNNYIHNYSESITEELVTNISNWFRKKDNPEIKKIIDIEKELKSSENKSNNYSSFIFFYYLGISQILLKEKEKGLDSLKKAKELINEEYTYLFNCYLNSNAYEKYNEQLLNMVTLLYSIEQLLIDNVIEYIKANKNFQLKKTTLDIYFQQFDKYMDSFEELKDKGLYIIFIPESSSLGILSFVTKFFSKLIKNLKEPFSLKGSINFRRLLLDKIKNNTKYNGKYKIENENENLNFLQKIKVSFYDALFEPNFQQNKLLDYKEIAKKKKNPLFSQIMANYEKQYTNFLEKNLKEINFDELKNAELNFNKFINELNINVRKEMIQLLENDEEYKEIMKNLKVCNFSKNILIDILMGAKNIKFPKITEVINLENLDELSIKYAKIVYQKIKELYLENEKNINRGIYLKFFENLKKIVVREKAKLDAELKEFMDQKTKKEQKEAEKEQQATEEKKVEKEQQTTE
jgi:hypothetical protein